MKVILSSYRTMFVIFLISILVSGCTDQTPGQSGESQTIKIAVLPVLDTLPMYVADQEGLFEDHNLAVEFIAAGSAPKRDELINSGQVDGMVNEVVSTVFYNRDEPRVQIVRYARTATPDSPIFRIISSGQSGITEVTQLKNVPIGVSQGTVIEYLTDRLLQAEGFDTDEIQVVAVPDIGQRMALLGTGELSAAMLPDPLASLVITQGAHMVIEDSSYPEFSHSVYTFRKPFIEQNQEAMKGFLAAIEGAVEMINDNPDRYSDLLTEREMVPEPLAGKFSVPKFVTAGVPSRKQWDDVIDWIQTKGLDIGNASYDTSVTAEFLPE